MIEINRKLISELFDKALLNPRFRQNYDLRNPDDNGQRMLNALMPGTDVPIHRHTQSNETVIILCGKLIEITYDNNGNETGRIHLDPSLATLAVWCLPVHGIRWRCMNRARYLRRRMGLIKVRVNCHRNLFGMESDNLIPFSSV